jgi:hypothetical protein
VTKQDKMAVLHATYGAAFVTQMNNGLAFGASFDKTMENCAEAAITIAREAVRQLEEFYRDEAEAQR